MTRSKITKNDGQVWTPIIAAIFMAMGLIVGYKYNPSNESDFQLLDKYESSTTTIQSVGRVEEILRFVENSYVDSVDNDKLLENTIRDILSELDPFSSYISQEELQEYNDELDGYFRGIGINYIQFNDSIFITDVMENGPASRQGLSRGHVILMIGEDTVSGNGLDMDTVKQILMDKEEEFSLKVYDPASNKVLTKDLEIEKIVVNTSNVVYEIEDGLVYLKIERFSSNTYRQFMEALESIKETGSSFDLVLDLRDNPGGYLPETIKILSQLIADKQKLLTYTIGSHRKRREYKSTGQTFYEIGKIAVLINEFSASGSEIIAGALQDWDRAVVIGTPSYGKGLVQEIHELKNGGALRLTVARYMTPSGRSIQKPYELQNETVKYNSGEEIFKSKVYGRDLKGGGGISPDVFELGHDQFAACDSFDFDHLYTFLLFHYPYRSPFENEEIFLSDFEITNEDFDSYKSFVAKHSAIDVPMPCLSAFEYLSKNIISEVWYSDVVHQRSINENDMVIQKAVDVLRNDNLQALLTNHK